MYYIYILRCIDGSLYTGITTDVERRFREHCNANGVGAKYTRSHKPECVEVVWSSSSRSDASKLEAFLKKLHKKNKLMIISRPELIDDLCKEKIPDSRFVYEGKYTNLKFEYSEYKSDI